MINDFGTVLENESLAKYSTLGIGGVCKYLIKPNDEDSLKELLNYLNDNNIKYIILGNESNVIIDDGYFDGVVIKMDNFNEISIQDNSVTVGAGVLLPKLVNTCLNEGYTSLAFASMIPGCVGGSIVGNAGCYGNELFDFVKSVNVMNKNGELLTLLKEDISYGYRYTSLKGNYIVLSVTFNIEKGDVEDTKNWIREINQKRMESQPLDKRSVGSIFRNPEGYSSWKLISDLGLKGTTIGGAKISDKHANFIINDNNATFDDVISLIELVREKVKENYNIDMVVEPTIIRWNEV